MNELINKLLTAMEGNNAKYRYFGIRTDARSFSIGDKITASEDMSIYAEDGTMLDGTCATGFDYLYFDGENEDIEAVAKALEINSAYAGEHQYLIGGYDANYGDDEAEVIIKNAEVIMTIK